MPQKVHEIWRNLRAQMVVEGPLARLLAWLEENIHLKLTGTVVIEALADCVFEIGYPHAVPFQVTIYITPKRSIQEQ